MKTVKPNELLPEITFAGEVDLYEFAGIVVSRSNTDMIIKIPGKYFDNAGLSDENYVYFFVVIEYDEDENPYISVKNHISEIKSIITELATYGDGSLLTNAMYISKEDLEAFKVEERRKIAEASERNEYKRYLYLKEKYEPEAPVITVRPRKVYLRPRNK